MEKVDFEILRDKAKKSEQDSKAFLKRLSPKKRKSLDSIVHELHHDEFEKFDCLNCANCCKSISPTLYDRDIDRAAKHLKMKSTEFINQYLYIDDDNDYVFKETPCPFLMPDNYCMIYESRPKACREYPHTDRKNFYQIFKLSIRNTFVCPIVYNVIDKLKKSF